MRSLLMVQEFPCYAIHIVSSIVCYLCEVYNNHNNINAVPLSYYTDTMHASATSAKCTNLLTSDIIECIH